MHEMSLAQGILQIVEDTLARNGGGRVNLVRLEVGQLAGVELSALRFSFEVVAGATAAAGAALEIEEPPGQAWCLQCSRTVPVPGLGEPCPLCGSYQLQVTGGTELRVKEIGILALPVATGGGH
jgi:hydrogenase nickel incorporation protein HypA/HybF